MYIQETTFQESSVWERSFRPPWNSISLPPFLPVPIWVYLSIDLYLSMHLVLYLSIYLQEDRSYLCVYPQCHVSSGFSSCLSDPYSLVSAGSACKWSLSFSWDLGYTLHPPFFFPLLSLCPLLFISDSLLWASGVLWSVMSPSLLHQVLWWIWSSEMGDWASLWASRLCPYSTDVRSHASLRSSNRCRHFSVSLLSLSRLCRYLSTRSSPCLSVIPRAPSQRGDCRTRDLQPICHSKRWERILSSCR